MIKQIAKRIVGKRILQHKVTLVSNYRFFRKHHGFGKFLKFLVYYGYKTFMESVSKNNFIQMGDYKMKLIPNDVGISKELKVFRSHEPLVTKLLSNVLKPKMNCFDIGGNIGYYVLHEHNLIGREGKIIAFEPSPKNMSYLKENLKINKITNVDTFEYAIGDVDGEKKFLLPQASNSSRIVDSDSNPDLGDVISVKMMKLDNFVSKENIKKIDFIRMDIEGSEFEAYSGMKNVISNHHPQMLIEIHGGFLGKEKTISLFQMMEKDGYEVKFFVPRNIDVGFLGNENDVKIFSIKQIISLIAHGDMPDTFHVFLVHQK